ncbi:UV-damage endonuclease [Xylariomycetidae sp. FL0641]|nr:UV-damage endonuclease [Xylariomycetidae sp. FL0641]
MVPKRKSSDMALLSQDIPLGAASSPERPDLGPRRSGRTIKRPGQGLRPTNSAGNEDDTPRAMGATKLRHEELKAGDGVEVALHGLQQTEASLRNAVKRQKRQINESKSSTLGNQDEFHDEDAAFLPKPTKPLPDVVPAKIEKNRIKKNVRQRSEQKPGKQNQYGEDEVDEAKGARAVDDDLADPAALEKEADGENLPDDDVNAIKKEGARPPPVNSDYLPLPWKGRLGYACLNTYLRQCYNPVFSSRTCRIASIIEHRHPLQDPSQPEHATKNRPDKTKPASKARGQKYVENLGLANARDIVKMLRWNDKYGIKFMRLSSEMFPFASHEEYGYKLAPFASETLAEAGKVAAELGHRLTTHPGQFTQLGSPRAEVVKAAFRDLEYHDEMLSLLRLPEQQNRDAVMIIHMGGVFGDKAATLDRFRANYARLPAGVRARLVLENDDVSWTVHDLLPVCEELGIPFVLDFHHHNILFDAAQLREGTRDITALYPRIKATWDRKRITPKMHYSEPCPDAVTGRQRRKHRPRVAALPPCPADMDLMIEAKDKEQAVFELMRTFKLPGWDSFNDVVPFEREDENRPLPRVPKKKTKKKTAGKGRKKRAADEEDGYEGEEKEEEKEEEDEGMKLPREVPEEERGMGGPENRVYWPVGMEEWLRPKKREVKKKKKADEEEDGDE